VRVLITSNFSMISPYNSFLQSLPLAQRRALPVLYANTLDFSSNDYLNLSRHPLLIERAQQWLLKHGAGSRAARLVAGNHPDYEQVEAKLASLKHTEAALILSSGYQTNSSVLTALLNKDVLGAEPLVFADQLNHASLLSGVQNSGARQFRYKHNDLKHLETLLKKYAPLNQPLFVVTESVFSMEGDRTDLKALLHLKQQYGFFLYLDEAHASGVLGHNGMGLAADYPQQIDCVMGTFGKALGSFGAYIACAQPLKDYLINRCGGFIYTTALPPAVWGAIDAALDVVPTLSSERAHLLKLAETLRVGLEKRDFAIGNSSTQIVPMIISEAAATLVLARHLQEHSIQAIAIRPPTVPPHTSRIRLALKASHTIEDIEKLLQALDTAPCR
jgi:8-amino-7-oxononanoate synthase